MAIPTSASRTKKELEAISKKVEDTKLKLKDFIFPVIIIVVLLVIVIVVFVPMVNNAISFRNELKEIQNKEKQLNELKVKLEKIDSRQLEADLMDVKSVIPKNLKVSSFIFYIDALAKEMNLTSESISAGDIKIATEEATEEYKGVNSPLSYSGSLENVLAFLDSFYTSSPYIVSPKNINLESNANGEWEVALNLTGYYIDDAETTRLDIYLPFKPYTDFSTEMQVLRGKATKLKSSN
ncbi:MAG TPA: hypothetical protein VJY47_01530 [Candidatus Dojkabacteria bacterium]|jgi:Tfp pilus assembly protein PilO|nr:hypothetical protein [Candidatus Dojkabacteria bacterium]